MVVSLSLPISPSSTKTPAVQLATVILGSTIVFAEGMSGGRVPSPPTQGPANRDGMKLNEGQY